jgi:hypothetical protein
VEFINWDGAVFGPGSEWLWSMLQFILMTISLVAITCSYGHKERRTSYNVSSPYRASGNRSATNLSKRCSITASGSSPSDFDNGAISNLE